MAKRKRTKRGRRHAAKLTSQQIAFLTRGMASPNIAAIARSLGLGKDVDAVRRAIKQAKSADN